MNKRALTRWQGGDIPEDSCVESELEQFRRFQKRLPQEDEPSVYLMRVPYYEEI